MAARRLVSMVFARGVTSTANEFTATCKPTNFQKRILVWARSYEDASKIPERVSVTQLRKAYDIMRSRATVLLTVGGMAGCMGIIFVEQHHRNQRLGLRDPQRGN